MNVLVINANRYKNPMPVMPVGACIVAEAAQRAGHAVRLLDLTFAKNPAQALDRELASHPPNVVGISVRNIDNNDLRNPVEFAPGVATLVAQIRGSTPAPIVLGGTAVGLMPEALLRATGAQWAVLSDGESVFPKWLDALSSGSDPASVPGVAWLRDRVFGRGPSNGHAAMAECLAPDFARWIDLKSYLAAMCTAPVQTKRGCDQACVYCTYHFADGPTYRMAPPASVVEAIRRLAAAGIRDIEFVDSVFNAPYGHALELCERLATARLPVRLHTMELNPRSVDDALFAAMERAGFVAVAITADSAADPVLQGLGKGYTSERVRQAAEVVARHRIPCLWIFLLGGPGEAEPTVRETLRFAATAIRRSDVAFFNVGLRIYPGAGIERIAREQGLLTVPPEEMLSPVFYVSPELHLDWLGRQLRVAVAEHPNYLGPVSINVPFLPLLYRMGRWLGIRPPLWRFTRPVRRLLRLVGKDPC